MLRGYARAYGLERVFARRNAGAKLRERSHEIASDVVVPAVIAALHANDVSPARHSTAQTDGLVGGLAPSVQKLDRLCGGYVLTNQLRQRAFEHGSARSKQARRVTQYAHHCFGYIWVVVAEEVGTESS